MSETKHTPGPWARTPYSSVLGVVITAQPDATQNSQRIAGVGGPQVRKVIEANARLIAAAPDMLEALRVAQKWLANCVPATEIDGPKPLPMVAAALAKAEGRS